VLKRASTVKRENELHITLTVQFADPDLLVVNASVA